MAKNIPGVVRVQRNSATRTYHLTIPKNVREDISLEPQDFVVFVKSADGWVLQKISDQEKEHLREAHRNGLDVNDILRGQTV